MLRCDRLHQDRMRFLQTRKVTRRMMTASTNNTDRMTPIVIPIIGAPFCPGSESVGAVMGKLYYHILSAYLLV